MLRLRWRSMIRCRMTIWPWVFVSWTLLPRSSSERGLRMGKKDQVPLIINTLGIRLVKNWLRPMLLESWPCGAYLQIVSAHYLNGLFTSEFYVLLLTMMFKCFSFQSTYACFSRDPFSYRQWNSWSNWRASKGVEVANSILLLFDLL